MSGTVQTQATNLLSGIPFGYLIGAPLVAAIDAQGLAAMETVKFIEAVGFTSSGVPPVTTAQTVTFTYTKPVTPTGGGTPVSETMTLTVPLLSIVDIPFLRISQMTIAFTANIQADTSTQVTTANTTAFTANLSTSANFFFASAKLNASISNTSSTNTTANSTYNVQYTMGINVTAEQDSMPAGLQAILNILANAIAAQSPAAAAASSGH